MSSIVTFRYSKFYTMFNLLHKNKYYNDFIFLILNELILDESTIIILNYDI